jgi:hypothetical protein
MVFLKRYDKAAQIVADQWHRPRRVAGADQRGNPKDLAENEISE